MNYELLLGKNGGNMGENGCVAWIFEQKGLITVKMSEKDEEGLLELAIDAGGGRYEKLLTTITK